MSAAKKIPIREACDQLEMKPDFIARCVRLRWIEPVDQPAEILDDEDLARLQLIRELIEIFEVNEAAVPVILHLVDELHSLRNLVLKSKI